MQALEAANIAFGRIADLTEVTGALTNREKAEIEKTYKKTLKSGVRSILNLLAARGNVFIKQGVPKNYYGANSILNKEESQLPSYAVSCQGLVLRAVHEIVELNQCAVYPSEVYNYTLKQVATQHLSSRAVASAMYNLMAAGELKAFKTIYENDRRGKHLYLPVELNTDDYLPQKPLSWLVLVAEKFNEIWTEKIQQSIQEKRKPFPISTNEVRARLEAETEPHKYLKHPGLVH